MKSFAQFTESQVSSTIFVLAFRCSFNSLSRCSSVVLQTPVFSPQLLSVTTVVRGEEKNFSKIADSKLLYKENKLSISVGRQSIYSPLERMIVFRALERERERQFPLLTAVPLLTADCPGV